MKILIVIVSFLLVSCAGAKFVVEEEPCDGVVNRPGHSVCGKDRVRKNCQPYQTSKGKAANTCEEL